VPKLIPYLTDNARAMVFVDGENLAIRYGSMLKTRATPPCSHVQYEPNVFVWSQRLNSGSGGTAIVRRHYYTSVQGDEVRLNDVAARLKLAGLEAPRVFKKDKSKGSKRVDISLSTDMLLHATRRHYDIAVLVAGDEDYVPLVQAVQGEGARVHVWFVPDGLSSALHHQADSYFDLADVLFSE
jgi:NYN domain